MMKLMIKICPECGSKLGEDETEYFCTDCGFFAKK